MSINDKIEALKKQLAELEAAKAAASAVQIGNVVTFPFGRGESKTTKQGVIVGVSPDGKQVRIITGDGFTTEALTAYRSQCEKVEQAEVPPVAEATLNEAKEDAAAASKFEQQQAEAAAEGAANVAAAASVKATLSLDDDLPI